MPAALLLVDDHVVVRNGLAELIEVLGAYEVVGQYSNGQELLQAIPAFQEARPELILMDLTMPVLDGEQTLKQLNEIGCSIPVLILTLNTDDATLLRLYRLGAAGYLPKDCTADMLREAIESILKRGYHQSDALHKALVRGDPRPSQQAVKREAVLKQLTVRELEFLQWVCREEEYTYDQIADSMRVSFRTVNGYRESLFDKFDIKSKTGLVLFAIRYQLVDL